MDELMNLLWQSLSKRFKVMVSLWWCMDACKRCGLPRTDDAQCFCAVIAESGKPYEEVAMELRCSKCGKNFTYMFNMPKNGPEPCLQGLLPQLCQECDSE